MREQDLRTLTERTVTAAQMIHNYKVAPDHGAIASYDYSTGVMEVVDPQGQHHDFQNLLVGEYYWSPDSTMIAYTALEQIRVALYRDAEIRLLNLRSNQDRLLYRLEDGYIHGLEWSPHGDAMYFLELINEPERQVGYLKRLDLSGNVTLIARSNGRIHWFGVPTTYFEYGQGNSRQDYRIVYGIDDGVFICDRDGGNTIRIIDYPGDGVDNVEWSPQGDRLAMNFRYPQIGDDGTTLQGLYLVVLQEGMPVYYPLYEGLDVHTLWWGPEGVWLSYANANTLYLYNQRTGERRELTMENLRGFHFSDDGEQIVITAANKVYLYLINEEQEERRGPFQVMEHGDPSVEFLAEPQFFGREIIFTVFEDVEARERLEAQQRQQGQNR